MLTVLTSGKTAPGVTTATWALAMSWPRALLVADCDLAGGDMVPGRLAGRVDTDAGLLSWAAAVRHGSRSSTAASLLLSHTISVPEHPMLSLVPGLSTAAQGASLTRASWERLADAFGHAASSLGRDVLVDTGRMTDERGCWPVVRAADRVLVAVRSSVRSVHAAQDCVRRIRSELGDLVKVGALVIGDGPYPAREVAGALGLPLVGVLPQNSSAATALSDGVAVSERSLRRSDLLRAAASVAAEILAHAPQPRARAAAR